ncbi:alpha/beta hydrolase [Lactobacillus sp. ESL0791]|uniref:alpha/beta hydrolase n=1 Tax=Lactobacillus sp. ESL0791 TaxID=2983234 RepID=UPI0023F6B9EA|nr:alpha/beta hydrolase [Lactobacillus sp. ESL0791]MDF7639752.1 alpha/beta hydrolase [Lactobacillus sp. ESL0791]
MIHKTIPITIGNRGNGATLTTYILENFSEIDNSRKRPAILICPGGSYRYITERETEAVAIKMNSLGFHAFILRYTVTRGAFPQSLYELAASVKTVRDNCVNWMIDPNKIIVAGFSAGGHLAASLGVFWKNHFLQAELKGNADAWKPSGLMLGYPVLSSGRYAHSKSFRTLLGDNYDKYKEKVSLEKQVNSAVPPTFLWHTVSDAQVPVENSLLFAQALSQHGIPFALHIFSTGRHGISLATSETSHDKIDINSEVQIWPSLFATWVNEQFNKS